MRPALNRARCVAQSVRDGWNLDVVSMVVEDFGPLFAGGVSRLASGWHCLRFHRTVG